VDQHPVTRPDAPFLAVEEAHVDVAAYSCDVDFGQPIQVIDDLDDLARDRQAHARCSTTQSLTIVNAGNRGYQPTWEVVLSAIPEA
jgi:hypothetical protein